MFAMSLYLSRDHKLHNATSPDSEIPFVAIKDISEVAFHALTDEKPAPESMYLFGPEKLTWVQVAEKISKATGQKVVYEEVDAPTREKQYEENGAGGAYGQFLTYLETQAFPSDLNDVVSTVCGRKGTSVDDWLAENEAKIFA
jgi:uncharacterized protein YbjT (DUF2867 family)